jgi:hypothetical protein
MSVSVFFSWDLCEVCECDRSGKLLMRWQRRREIYESRARLLHTTRKEKLVIIWFKQQQWRCRLRTKMFVSQIVWCARIGYVLLDPSSLTTLVVGGCRCVHASFAALRLRLLLHECVRVPCPLHFCFFLMASLFPFSNFLSLCYAVLHALTHSFLFYF